jgi:hypothetical protein
LKVSQASQSTKSGAALTQMRPFLAKSGLFCLVGGTDFNKQPFLMDE